jgi:hypothetical protein
MEIKMKIKQKKKKLKKKKLLKKKLLKKKLKKKLLKKKIIMIQKKKKYQYIGNGLMRKIING